MRTSYAFQPVPRDVWLLDGVYEAPHLPAYRRSSPFGMRTSISAHRSLPMSPKGTATVPEAQPDADRLKSKVPLPSVYWRVSPPEELSVTSSP